MVDEPEAHLVQVGPDGAVQLPDVVARALGADGHDAEVLFTVDRNRREATIEPIASDRGRRAWDLLRRTWGRAIADALWRGQHVQVLAKNGNLYEVWFEGFGRYGSVRTRNLTTGDKLCAQLWGGYPDADCLFTVLEHLRVDPDHVERTAVHTPDSRTVFRRAFRGMQNLGLH